MSCHQNIKIEQCGLYINKEFPYLHATPDFIYSCDCCEETGCGEVKCPFCLYNTNINEYVNNKNSCLIYTSDGKLSLSKNHPYYFQVQQQLFTLNKQFCYFIVFGTDESNSITLFYEKINKRSDHWDSVLPKLHFFWSFCILPEILARWYTRKGHLLNTGECENIQYSGTHVFV